MKHFLYCVSVLLLLPAACSAQFLFEDVTLHAGLRQQSAGTQNIGPGVVIFDLDNDGWDDIYMAGGLDSDKLYRNMHDGTFMDISDSNFKVHNNFLSRTRGGTAFDFDNDGFTDLYATTENLYFLWKNNGDGTFTNVIFKA